MVAVSFEAEIRERQRSATEEIRDKGAFCSLLSLVSDL
jgi:hypothetical protein